MSFLTIAGEQQLANKQGNGERVNIAKFVLAYRPDQGNEPEDRVESVPDDAFIVDTRAYTKRSYVNGNQVVYSLVMDSSVGDFTFNWIGLVDDENVLIAVAHITAIDKTKSSEGVRGNTIARNFLLKYTGIQNLTATTVPAETWQLDFSTRMAGIDERERLSNFDIFGHESFLDDAWLVSGANGAYQIATGVGYVGGVRIDNLGIVDKTISYPNQLWLNVSLQGDVSDRSAVVEFVMDSGEFEDYEDDNGVTHYLTKLADIAADGSVIDTRTIYENVAQHEAKEDPHPQYKTYTDVETSAALTSAKSDASTKANSALASAKSYTDAETSAALSTAKSDATTKSNAALSSAKSYTDAETSAALTAAKSDASTKANSALASAKSYTDEKNASTLSSALSTSSIDATTKATNAVSTAKSYTDAQALSTLTAAKDYVGDIRGAIHFFATQIAPEGFIKANGATLQIDSFPELHAKIGTTFGGDGVDTFAVPDLRGEFVRGYDDGRGVDSGRGFGSWQADAIRNITGNINITSNVVRGYGGVFSSGSFDANHSVHGTNSSSYGGTQAHFDASNVVPTAADNRPRNIALIAYIKY